MKNVLVILTLSLLLMGCSSEINTSMECFTANEDSPDLININTGTLATTLNQICQQETNGFNCVNGDAIVLTDNGLTTLPISCNNQQIDGWANINSPKGALISTTCCRVNAFS